MARSAVEELDEPACRRLLSTAPMGRIGFTHGALPKILPVHCTLRGHEVVIAGRAGGTVDIRAGEIVAFEADAYDPVTGEGWSVGLVGPCRVVTGRDEIAELDAAEFSPWPSDDGGTYFGIGINLLRGQALTAVAAPAAVSG